MKKRKKQLKEAARLELVTIITDDSDMTGAVHALLKRLDIEYVYVSSKKEHKPTKFKMWVLPEEDEIIRELFGKYINSDTDWDKELEELMMEEGKADIRLDQED